MDEKLFDELIGALKGAAAFERGEKMDLRVVTFPPSPKQIAEKDIIGLRKRLAMLRAVFARHSRGNIDESL